MILIPYRKTDWKEEGISLLLLWYDRLLSEPRYIKSPKVPTYVGRWCHGCTWSAWCEHVAWRQTQVCQPSTFNFEMCTDCSPVQLWIDESMIGYGLDLDHTTNCAPPPLPRRSISVSYNISPHLLTLLHPLLFFWHPSPGRTATSMCPLVYVSIDHSIKASDKQRTQQAELPMWFFSA